MDSVTSRRTASDGDRYPELKQDTTTKLAGAEVLADEMTSSNYGLTLRSKVCEF
jgi:hypothetical protein